MKRTYQKNIQRSENIQIVSNIMKMKGIQGGKYHRMVFQVMWMGLSKNCRGKPLRFVDGFTRKRQRSET